MFKLKSLKLKILIIFLIESITITLIILFSSQQFFIEVLKKNIDNNAKKIVNSYSNKIGNWFYERMNEISIYASINEVKSMQWDKMETFLKKEAEKKKDTYLFFFVSDSNGNYNTTLKRNAGTISDREYFKKIISEGVSLVSEPVISKSTGKQISVVASPIRNDKNEVVGIMAGTLDLIKLYKWIGDFKLDHTDSYSYIIDANGLVITHPNINYIMQLDLSLEHNNFDKKVLNKMLTSNEGVVHYDFNGIKSFAYFKEIPNTSNWKIVTRIPDNYLFQSVYETRNKLLIISIAFIIFATLFGLWYSNSIAKPIIQLKNRF